MEQEHDKVTLRGLQRAMALQEKEVTRTDALPGRALARYEERQRMILAEHEAELAEAAAQRQRALDERERIATQIAEVAGRVGT